MCDQTYRVNVRRVLREDLDPKYAITVSASSAQEARQKAIQEAEAGCDAYAWQTYDAEYFVDEDMDVDVVDLQEVMDNAEKGPLDVEMYVGYMDRTWNNVLVEIPGDTPEDKIEEVASEKLQSELSKQNISVAFVGLYSM